MLHARQPAAAQRHARNLATSFRVLQEQFKNLDRQMAHSGQARTARASDEDARQVENPKANPDPNSNQQKYPDDWVTGHEPMTGAQASYLKTLSEQAHDPDAYEPDLDKAEASKRIDHLKQETGR